MYITYFGTWVTASFTSWNLSRRDFRRLAITHRNGFHHSQSSRIALWFFGYCQGALHLLSYVLWFFSQPFFVWFGHHFVLRHLRLIFAMGLNEAILRHLLARRYDMTPSFKMFLVPSELILFERLKFCVAKCKKNSLLLGSSLSCTLIIDHCCNLPLRS
jgi:hypothetical protein